MFTWLVDNANIVYFVLGVTALGLGVAGFLTGRARYLGWAGGVVGLMLLFWLLTRLYPTDRKQMVANLETMKQGVLDRNADAIFHLVARDFKFQEMDRKELYHAISRTIQHHKVQSIHLWDQQASLENGRGEVTFNFRADAEGDLHYLASARAIFVKEESVWKLRELKIYPIGLKMENEIRVPLR